MPQSAARRFYMATIKMKLDKVHTHWSLCLKVNDHWTNRDLISYQFYQLIPRQISRMRWTFLKKGMDSNNLLKLFCKYIYRYAYVERHSSCENSLYQSFIEIYAISAVARYQILSGHTVNRSVGTGGAELHKSQNIGWARARVPTIRIRLWWK